ncbi:hypothetical protein ACK8QS_18015 [Ectopseudomonas mendocina]
MASKPNTARQHKHFAVLIDAVSALFAIVEVFKRWTSFVMYALQISGLLFDYARMLSNHYSLSD